MNAKISRQLMRILGGRSPEKIRRSPDLFRRIEIQILLNLAADTFGVPAEKVWKYPAEKALQRYAAFTERCMEGQAISTEQIYSKAFALGESVRRKTGLTDPKDLQRLVFFLYRNINITMDGDLPGEITVPNCYFSKFYSPQQCALMSFVDSGIVAGILGGGQLVFSQRITEGCACCKACFEKSEQ